MNDQELSGKLWELEVGVIKKKAEDGRIITFLDSNTINTIVELTRQDQSIREIDIRIDEIKYLSRGDVVYIDMGEREVEERISELQAQKDKLIKGVK